MDAILADGASLESFEDDLRRTISSPEERSTPLGRTWCNFVEHGGTGGSSGFLDGEASKDFL